MVQNNEANAAVKLSEEPALAPRLSEEPGPPLRTIRPTSIAPESRTRVLLVEDDPLDVKLFQRALDSAFPGMFDIKVLPSLNEGLESLRSFTYDAACVDLKLGDAQALESIRRLRDTLPELPLIVLSADNNEQLALQAVHAGAQDYLVKGKAAGTHIAQALKYARERKRSEAELLLSAESDALTGLGDRRVFRRRLDAALSRASERNEPLAVVMFDLDDFKPVNDSLGHSAGDAVLVEIAHRLRTCLGEGDCAARLGGDEFAVLLTHLRTPEQAAHRASEILEVLCAPMSLAGSEMSPSASLGVALSPDCGTDSTSLLGAADAAMYEAKRAGKGQARIYQPARDTGADPTPLAARLENAYNLGLFHWLYQSIFDCDGNRVAVEALLRMTQPGGEVVAATSFISALQRAGLTLKLAPRLLGDAFALARRMNAARPPTNQRTLRVGVNVHPGWLLDPEFSCLLERVATTERVAPDQIELELGLSARLPGTEQLAKATRAIAAQGYHIVLDGFGTQHLGLLAGLPVAGIKLAFDLQTLVHGTERDRRFLGGLFQLARGVDAWVCATRLEAEVDVRAFATLGCDRVQGYALAQPQTGKLVTELIRNQFIAE